MLERTVVTAVGQDGLREARRLAGLNPDHAVFAEWRSLGATLGSSRCAPLFLILVCHHSELEEGYAACIGTLSELRREGKLPPILTLANCYSGLDQYRGPLLDNKISLGQRVAQALDVEVRATTRVLQFEEVGRSLAFARSAIASMLLPTNNATVGELWTTFKKLPDVEWVELGLRNL